MQCWEVRDGVWNTWGDLFLFLWNDGYFRTTKFLSQHNQSVENRLVFKTNNNKMEIRWNILLTLGTLLVAIYSRSFLKDVSFFMWTNILEQTFVSSYNPNEITFTQFDLQFDCRFFSVSIRQKPLTSSYWFALEVRTF